MFTLTPDALAATAEATIVRRTQRRTRAGRRRHTAATTTRRRPVRLALAGTR
jgi:hypothetical protein